MYTHAAFRYFIIVTVNKDLPCFTGTMLLLNKQFWYCQTWLYVYIFWLTCDLKGSFQVGPLKVLIFATAQAVILIV